LPGTPSLPIDLRTLNDWNFALILEMSNRRQPIFGFPCWDKLGKQNASTVEEMQVRGSGIDAARFPAQTPHMADDFVSNRE
jgi:hypothetical protein